MSPIMSFASNAVGGEDDRDDAIIEPKNNDCASLFVTFGIVQALGPISITDLRLYDDDFDLNDNDLSHAPTK